MKPLLIALCLLCSTASAQWPGYVPIEQSRSYNAYRGPYYGGYGYYGRVYPRARYGGYGYGGGYGGPQPLRLHYMQSSSGEVYNGFSY